MSHATSLPTGQEQQTKRFNFGLIHDVFAVLEQHGYVKGDNQAVGSAVGALLALVEAFEGGQS